MGGASQNLLWIIGPKKKYFASGCSNHRQLDPAKYGRIWLYLSKIWLGHNYIQLHPAGSGLQWLEQPPTNFFFPFTSDADPTANWSQPGAAEKSM